MGKGSRRFEEKIRMFMRSQHMYKPGSKILVGVSGGKDSMVLATVLEYIARVDGVSVELLHLNFGYKGSDLLEKHVIRFARELGLPLHLWRLRDEWGMDFKELAEKVGGNPCSVCSTLLRYYLLWFGRSYDAVATGHNLDDVLSFYLYNAMTGNFAYSSTLRPVLRTAVGTLKVRPFFFVPEERIREEAERRGITPFPVGCPSDKEAPTVKIRHFLRDLESRVPGARKNLLRFFLATSPEPREAPNRCKICGMPSRGDICAVCKMKIKVGLLEKPEARGKIG